jgi:spermidine synthase
VDWIDIDADLVQLCERHLEWAPGVRTDQRVHYQGVDIAVALPALGQYDAIILDLPDPDGATGYLYSDAFWTAIRSHVGVGGRLVTHCGPVRPFGTIGEGFNRIRDTSRGFRFDLKGFYTQPIPSFQGEWGFWLWARNGGNPFEFIEGNYRLPEGLRVVDGDQLRAWYTPSLRWREALSRFSGSTESDPDSDSD